LFSISNPVYRNRACVLHCGGNMLREGTSPKCSDQIKYKTLCLGQVAYIPLLFVEYYTPLRMRSYIKWGATS